MPDEVQPPADQPEWMRLLSRGRKEGQADDTSDKAEMRANRRINAKLASGGGAAAVSFATGRPRDPLFYWKMNNLPWDVSKKEELSKVRTWCRILYQTHPVVASAVDIYSRYPLVGMEFKCKDSEIEEFYTTLFFDDLDYEEYLIDVGRQYWLEGEAFPLGTFNETLGVWEADELIDPEDVDVIRSPFLKETRFEMRLPPVIRKVIQERSPAWEFEALMAAYPELANFVGEHQRMPVSNVLMKHLKFKGDLYNPRGIPILMRAFRTLIQEEMLNAAQDAVADRLYTPLVLAKLGASATDLGTTQPWIPTEDDLASFEEALDAALAGDFRILTHHFAVDVRAVFGREQMPRLDSDFDRITERILQVFGLSKTMLSGASSGQTYAADALNRDLVSQLLNTYKRRITRFVSDRMMVVAEAQGHYDYEERAGKRHPVMEEVLEFDEETGEQRIVEQHKLLIPDLVTRDANLRDEENLRQFYEALRASGVPISMETRLVNVPIDLKEEIQRSRQEQVDLVIEAQEVRKETYLALKAKGLPIAQDLRDDFEPKAGDAAGGAATPAAAPPALSVMPAPVEAIVPPFPGMEGDGAGPADGSNVVTLPRNQAMPPQRPEESDEMRAGMPKPAVKITDDEGEEQEVLIEEGRARLISGPRHIGSRRHSPVPWPEDQAVP